MQEALLDDGGHGPLNKDFIANLDPRQPEQGLRLPPTVSS